MNYAEVFEFNGTWFPLLRMYGRTVDAIIRLDRQELKRREDVGLGSLLDKDLLQALAVLPYATKVAWKSIDPLVQIMLDQAPEGVVQRDPFHVERLYRPALTVVGIVKRSRSWIRALEAVSLFAPHSPRGLVLLGDGAEEETLIRARRVGVGVARQQPGGSMALLVEPTRRHIRSGAGQWACSEFVLAEWANRYSASAQALS